MAKLDLIAQDVRVLRERLVEKIPGHFDMRHIITAFFGALFFGFTFVLKGLLLDVGIALSDFKLVAIVLATLIILSAEIYFVGYHRVPNKTERPFGQFWAKRIVAYYAIALVVSWLLLWLYDMDSFAGAEIHKLVVMISFPAAIGAAVSDLLGKY